MNAIANSEIGGANGGSCFGFSLSTDRILMGQKAVSDFPNNANGTIFGLDTPAGPSGPLTDYINAMSVSQFSANFVADVRAGDDQQLPAGTQIAFTWIIRRGRKIIARHSLLTAPSTRTAKYTFTAVVLSGITATTRPSPSRTLQFRG
ncbi:MAG TPA: hypothetical protein VMR14_10660 [Streptosporangiaceae bacterium]|nr:hypothetical protein [Streptosporangiaceae bacterium]